MTAGTGADAPANTYSYDPQTGNVAGIEAPGGKLSYAYDGFLPTSETLTGEVSGKVSYKYDNNFWVSSVAVNSEAPISYYYDSDGLLNGAGALGIYRDPKHGAITGTRLNNMSDSNTYDAFGGLASYKATFQSYYYNAPEDWFSASYKRDSLGRIAEKTETVGDVTSTYAYAYDGAGRLAEVKKDGQKVASYSYDENGNRLSETTLKGGTMEAAYDAQDRLTKRGQAEYSYAASGELEGKTEGGQDTSYAYDAFGNLKSVVLPDGKKVEYLADGKGRRVGKKVDGRLVKGFLYAGQLSPVAELDGAGKVVSRFVYGTRANVPDYMVKDGKTYRIVTDHLGSVRLVANAQSGEIVQRIDYDEFGNVLADSNPGFQPFGFAGGLYDTDTKLTRFGARDYDAEAGRWTAKDPLSFAAGDANLYGYVLSDPVNFFDADGLESDWVQDAGDWASGFGDTITLSGTEKVREAIGVDDAVNKCSVFYQYGGYGGEISTIPFAAAKGAKGAQAASNFADDAKRFTPDQDALVQLAKDAKQRGGVTSEEGNILKEWAAEYGLRPARGPEAHPGRGFGSKPHYRIGPVNHLPLK